MRLKVVIIDDEAEITIGLYRFISEMINDCEVVATFTNGKDALDYIKKNQVHIVITDINMPEINGIEIIKKLHSQKKNIDVIIISGHREFEYAMEALKYNVHRYIVKPIDFTELSSALAEIKFKYSKKNSENHDSNSYLISKTLIDIYTNSITVDKAKSILEYINFEADKYRYTNLFVKFEDLTYFLENQWSYGIGQFYDAISNIINDAGALSEHLLNKFYLLSAKDYTLEFVYVGDSLEKTAPDKLKELIKDNLHLECNITVNKTIIGLDAFSRQFNTENTDTEDTDNEDFIIQKAKAYIEQNYMHDISLYDAASHVKLNYVYFSKFFKQCTGVNFIDYIIDLRLNKAVELLKEKKYTISEISTMIGYQSQTYFLRLFKSHMGCSPKEFTRRYLIDETE